MTTALIKPDAEKIERVLIAGDLATLSTEERVLYYKRLCDSLGLNPMTKPFAYITLNGKLTLYALKDCTEQLRNIHNVSINITSREMVEGCYVVTARAKLPSGREDESIGVTPIDNLKGEARANSMMKGETKAKRRVTLSICGLGMLDELEVETIPAAKPAIERTVEAIPIIKVSTAASVLASGHEEVPSETSTSHTSSAAVEYISQEESVNFERAFKDALPESHRKRAKGMAHAWLQEHGIVGADKKPTAKAILKKDFYRLRDEAVAFAKNVAPLDSPASSTLVDNGEATPLQGAGVLPFSPGVIDDYMSAIKRAKSSDDLNDIGKQIAAAGISKKDSPALGQLFKLRLEELMNPKEEQPWI